MPDFSCLWINSGEDDILRPDYQEEHTYRHGDTVEAYKTM